MTGPVGYTLCVEVTLLATMGRLTDLSSNARLCLFVMALTARDKPSKHEPAHIYFGGWEYLARAALNRDQYDSAAERAVARAVGDLVTAGLVKPVGRRHGQRQGAAMYELVL